MWKLELYPPLATDAVVWSTESPAAASQTRAGSPLNSVRRRQFPEKGARHTEQRANWPSGGIYKQEAGNWTVGGECGSEMFPWEFPFILEMNVAWKMTWQRVLIDQMHQASRHKGARNCLSAYSSVKIGIQRISKNKFTTLNDGQNSSCYYSVGRLWHLLPWIIHSHWSGAAAAVEPNNKIIVN